MKACLLAVLSLLVASTALAQTSVTEKEALDYARSLDISQLDPTLPAQRLEDWMQSGPPHVDLLDWQFDPTCDNKMGDSSDTNYPLCVRVAFGRGAQSGYFLVELGTYKRGIIGPPQLYGYIGVQEEAFIQTGGTDHLSGLPNLLDQPPVTVETRHLFDEIVARHPVGIPKGADQAVIWPLLSKRLIQQLETAQVCQDDYVHLHPKPDTALKPAWLKTGLFTGDGVHAMAYSANPTSIERQKNGSVSVAVALTYDKAWVRRGGGFTPDHMWWHVEASVVQENNHFVVDDVRIFNGGNDDDGSSYLFSESFSGCDGPHWTGEQIIRKPFVAPPPPTYTDWNAVNVLRGAADRKETIFAQSLDVHQLDPLLPSQRLDVWLNSSSLHLNHLEWHAGGCNIKEGRNGVTLTPQNGLCATVWFQRGNARAHIRVRGGGQDPARIEYIGVADQEEGLLDWAKLDNEKPSDSDRLSDLPRLLNEEAVIDVTRNLYDQVVANHAIGIPPQTDKAVTPLLSKRLQQQFTAALSCQADYLRQHPNDSESVPRWFNTGVFSGQDDLASPSASLVDHKERQSDGSFFVFVWLSQKSSATAASGPMWRNWHASVTVKSEGGKYLVDEVRLFNGLSSNSPSHLLSNLFVGCDGPRWVGTSSC